MATIEDFEKVDIRVGKVVSAEDFPDARKPAYKLTIDFGPEVGVKRSSAQFAHVHAREDLVGRKVLGIVNLPPRRIGPFTSEVLTLGVPDENGHWIAIMPSDEDAAVLGGRLA